MDPSTTQVPAYCHWTPEQIHHWLVEAGLGRYRDLVTNQMQVDGKMLYCINASDLRRMGVPYWDDCRKLAEAVDELTQRKVELKKKDYAHLPYPYYPGLFFDDEPQLAIISHDEDSEQNPGSQRQPPGHQVYRHIYNTAGERFFYVDHNKVLSKL